MKFALFAIVAIAILVIVECKPASTNEKTCTARGGYCQNHWECCSKSCLSYSYKCVGEDVDGPYIPPIFAPPHVTDQDPDDAISLDELLENVFG